MKKEIKQATHVRPTNFSLMNIAVMDNGGFITVVDAGWEMDWKGAPRVGAAFTTAEECGAWVLGCLQNATAKKFGPKK